VFLLIRPSFRFRKIELLKILYKGGRRMIYQEKESSLTSFFAVIGFIGALIVFATINSFGQTVSSDSTLSNISQNEVKKEAVQEVKPAVLQPVFTEYKGIAIGMTADEVRDKIDKKPKIEDKDGFYYVFSDDEAMQIVLDENKKVKVISIIYSGDITNAPTYEAVFGKDVPLEPGADGRVYKLIRYPESGFWVAYSSGAGEKPIVTVTIQKLWDAK
jgi:hypothetical protein